MGVGFAVSGHVKKVDTFIRTTKRVAKKLGYKVETGEDNIWVNLCPMGDLGFTWTEDTKVPGQWRVEMDCATSPVGAGFHKAALEFTEQLGIQDMVVDDETEYDTHRDFDRMNREHFYPWLRSLLRIFQDLKGQNTDGQILLCWDIDSYHPEDVAETAATQLGRYTWAYLDKLVEQQGIEALADRFFLWGREEKDALYYRNTALYILWKQCYFRPSYRSKQDREINISVLKNLEKAYQLDPTLPLPYEAYEEVCGLHGWKPSIPQSVSRLSYEFPIGYRKRRVIVAIGPLRLTFPGAYQYEWEENGNGGGTNLWSDDSADSPVWRVSAYRSRQGDAQFSGKLGKEVSDLVERAIENGRICYGWTHCAGEEDDFWLMEAEVITGSWFYLISVAYRKPEQKAEIEKLLGRITAVARNKT